MKGTNEECAVKQDEIDGSDSEEEMPAKKARKASIVITHTWTYTHAHTHTRTHIQHTHTQLGHSYTHTHMHWDTRTGHIHSGSDTANLLEGHLHHFITRMQMKRTAHCLRKKLLHLVEDLTRHAYLLYYV